MYDAATSEEVLAFLKFALDMCSQPHHPREFYDKNSDVISLLTEQDKETLRQCYRDAQDRLRKAA